MAPCDNRRLSGTHGPPMIHHDPPWPWSTHDPPWSTLIHRDASQTAEPRVVVVPCPDGYSRKAWADMQFSCFCKVHDPNPNHNPTPSPTQPQPER